MNRPVIVLVVMMVIFISGNSANAAEQAAFDVRETVGIRRFGYPVAAVLKLQTPVAADTHFRLLHAGKPVAAQFRPIQHDGDRIVAVALDFDGNFMPHESREYVVEFGRDVPATPEPERGMKVQQADDTFVVSHGEHLSWTVPKNLLGLIQSVKTPKTDYLRPDSGGLFIRYEDDNRHRVGDPGPNAAPVRATVVKSGPIACRLRFEGAAALGESGSVASTVEMDFPRSKSWVQATWTVDDPNGLVAGLGVDMNLNVTGEPTLVDFGAGSLVYATLARGQVVVLRAGRAAKATDAHARPPLWETFRGAPGKLEPYVVGPSDATGARPEGWAHVMDSERCTAVAVAEFARCTQDRIEVGADGRLQVWRDFATEGAAPPAGPKSLQLWFHFVGMPPHVGAVTSPQSMQSPLEVEWLGRNFLGVPEKKARKFGDEAPESALRQFTKVSKVVEVGYERYLAIKKSEKLLAEEVHGDFIYFAIGISRHAPFPNGVSAYFTETQRYKARVPARPNPDADTPRHEKWQPPASSARSGATAPEPADIPGLSADDLTARAKAALAQTSGEIRLRGFKEPVEVLRDKWGVPHIYAQNPDDLFFAQGFVQAQDRLWQMEIWRRTTEGRLAEIVGPAAVERDRVARLVRFRGDMDAEWTSYSPDARAIIEAFVRGVNAFIELCRDNPPIEFQLTGIKPEPWTPEVCLGRMAGFIMCRNATNEVLRAQLVREIGPDETAKLLPTDPPQRIEIPDGLDLAGIDQRVVAGINAASGTIRVPLAETPHPQPLSPKGRGECVEPGVECAQSAESHQRADAPSPLGGEGWGEGSVGARAAYFDADADFMSPSTVGSNNWTVAGRLTTTGKPILANDPHRPITLPSLRYIVHLVCPPRGAGRGWNVIGGTEPGLPGVALGHNDRVAWGMTIVGTDQMDIYVEDTHPDDLNRYRVGDDWQVMCVEREQIRVRGEPEPREIELKFTRHGPVIFGDLERHRAYALRWTGSEPGTAGYLAALSVDRVESWPEFLEAATRWKIPSLNLVFADRHGHIGWIAAALTPVRRNWTGLLPVPGAAGRFEWDGFLPNAELPQRFDPPEGYIATANHNILPAGYRHQISYEWAAPFRFQRIDEVFRSRVVAGNRFSVADFEKLQHDATSIPARRLVALLRDLQIDDTAGRSGLDLLLRWDTVVSRDSAAAALYEVWQVKLTERVLKMRVPEKLWTQYSNRLPVQVLLDLVERPDSSFGPDPRAGRDTVLLDSLLDAIAVLQKGLSPDASEWRWGKLHEAHFQHMLATTPATQSVFNLPPVPRDGDAFTPLAAGGPSFGSFQQTTGASYRHILDLADWDRSVATSVPGQSGQPGSPHYDDLLPLWAERRYFPLVFSRASVDVASTDRLLLLPAP